ncbi:MAG: hypothetical protein U9R36_07095, partial [Elusimicrobiota bacterium]|nr:hypothetical protein [Elusimicrobiota bacterium]
PGVKIILNDVYLMQVVSYIHKNAVKAGIVKTVQEYKWHTDELYRKGSWKHEMLHCWEFPPFFKGKDRRLVYEERMKENTVFPENVHEYIGQQDEWEKLERRKQDRSGHFRERRGRLSMKEIAEDKANEAGITIQDLKAPGRRQAFVDIRQKAMSEMYAEGFGPSEIGKYFNRSKGSVVNAVNKFKN